MSSLQIFRHKAAHYLVYFFDKHFKTCLNPLLNSVKGEYSPAGRSNSALAFKAGCLYVFGGLNQTTGWLGDAWKGVLEGDTVSWEAIDTSDQFTPRDKMAFCQGFQKIMKIGIKLLIFSSYHKHGFHTSIYTSVRF